MNEQSYRILCIDPGPTSSGFVVIDSERNVLQSAIVLNQDLWEVVNFNCHKMVIEMIASYGMPVGKSTFNTVIWIGRFIEYFMHDYSFLITRKDVKKTIASGSAKDANIRQAIIDRYPPIGGGATPQIGTKKQPGPLYGMKSHMWQALALGHAYLDGCEHYAL